MKLKIAKDELEFDQKPTLNKNFWNGEKLNPEVKDAIMAVVESFLKSTNLELTVDDVDEIEFTGSLANYNYSKFSDVDIHLLFDFSKLGKDPDFMRELLIAKAIIWNDKNNVTLFGHEAELYITDAGTDHHSTGVYSVKNDEWLVKPVRDPKLSAELNLNKVKDKADKISKEIDMLVVKDELSLEKLERLKDRIKKMRVAGLETGGEFSTENLAFKLLRRRGELSTLSALMQQAKDEELSLDEDMEWWKKRRKKDNKNYRELMGYVGGKGVFKRKYASKNIGYPKSVSRKKLSKLGAPYMMDPPSKLPKSGPPGVGSLEEKLIKEVTDEIRQKIKEIEEKLDVFEEPVTMKLKGRSLFGFDCLKPHSYEIKADDIDGYNIKLKEKIDMITTPSAKSQQKAGTFDPLAKCVIAGGDGSLTPTQLRNMLANEMTAGNAEFVFQPIKLPPIKFDLPTIPKPATLESLFSKKIKAEKGGATVFIYPKEDMYFINWSLFKMPKVKQWGDVFTQAYYEKVLKNMTVPFKKAIFYSKGKENQIYFNKQNNKVSSTRSIPGTSIISELVKEMKNIIYEIQEKTIKASGLPDALKNRLLERAKQILDQRINEDFALNIIRRVVPKDFEQIKDFDSIENFLKKLDEETLFATCDSFDCKKSKIRKRWQPNLDYVTYERGNVGIASLKDYLGIKKAEKPTRKTEPSDAAVDLAKLKVVAKSDRVKIDDLEPQLKESLNNLAAYIAKEVGTSNVKIVVGSGKDTAGGHTTGGHPKGLAVDFNVKVGNKQLDQQAAYAYTLKAIADGKINGGEARIGYYGGEYDPQAMTPTNVSGIHMDLDFTLNKGAWFWFKCEDMIVCKDEACEDKLDKKISSRKYLRKYKKDGYRYVKSCKGKDLNGGPKVLSLAKGGKKLKTFSNASKKDIIEKNLLALPDDVLLYLV